MKDHRGILHRLFFLFYAVFFSLFLPTRPAFAKLSDLTLQYYSQNNIFMTDECESSSYTTSASGTVGTVAGTDNAAKIWNYFATANIPNLSNNAAAIAGILGNLYQETGLDPFSSNGSYFGLFQSYGEYDPGLLSAMEAAGLSQYWGSSSAPETAVDKAIQVELDYLTKNDERFLGTGWASDWGFLKKLPEITSKTPEAYSDLFLVTVEGAYTPNQTSPNTHTSNYVEDPVARNVGTKYFGQNPGGGSYYQEAETRRNYAREYFDKFSSAATITTANASVGISGASTGSANFSAVLTAKNADKSFFNGSGDVPSAEWSDTDDASKKRLLETYGDLAYQLGRAVNAPYIAILVQMRYEDPTSDCGKNNFWGNGCDQYHRGVGQATIQGKNLGEGFMQYGQTLTNGMHNQALGESDPKRYLEKIGPTWVNGDPNGAGYGDIEGMKASVDSLTNYINSAEGQAIVKTFGNYSASGSVDTASYSWADGWVSGIPGITKDDVSSRSLKERPGSYSTPDGKPNKILLHNTEGTGNGFAAYGTNTYPAHFIVDLVKKEGFQNLSLDHTAVATKSGDGSTVQIEIVGFYPGTGAANGSEKYDLSNFGDAEWDYLAVLLGAISSYTGIPLTTEVKWDVTGPADDHVRVSSNEEFANTKGIVGHMHAPGDDHTDPGNIWPQVSAAIARNPAGSSFSSGVNNVNPCLNSATMNCSNSVAPTGDKITWIGDSYSVQAEKSVADHLISKKFPGVDLGGEENINTPSGYIQGSKHSMIHLSANPSGINILKEIKSQNKLRPYLVFALGTNDADYATDTKTGQAMIDEVLSIAGSETHIILVTPKTPSYSYDGLAELYKQNAASHTNISVADWHAIAQDSDYQPGDIHLNAEGYEKWVNLIASAFPTSTNGADCATNNNGVTTTQYNGHTIAFPIAGAHKAMKNQHSNIPCDHAIGCHYGPGSPADGTLSAAYDICLGDNCDNQTVVAITGGTITKLSSTRTHEGETAACNHVRIKSDIDGTVFAYMHLTGESYSFKEGDHVNAGDIIGHISPGITACNDHSAVHVHIDKGKDPNATGGPSLNDPNSRDPEITKMINAAWNALPADAAALAAQSTSSGSGLTESQGTKLAEYYKTDSATSGYDLPSSAGKWNCVSLSAWWIQKFTTIGKQSGHIWGNGRDVSFNLKNDYSLSTGTTPRPYSIFSVTHGETYCGATLCGHTGVVLAVNGNDVLTLEAAFGKTGYTEARHRDLSYFVNEEHPNDIFAYLDTVMNQSELNNTLTSIGAKQCL